LQDSNQGLARWHTGPSKMGHGSLQDSTQDLARQDMGPSKTGHRAWQDGTWGLAEQDTRPCEMGQSQSMSPTVPPVADAWLWGSRSWGPAAAAAAVAVAGFLMHTALSPAQPELPKMLAAASQCWPGAAALPVRCCSATAAGLLLLLQLACTTYLSPHLHTCPPPPPPCARARSPHACLCAHMHARQIA
jgi:hypothetical protein